MWVETNPGRHWTKRKCEYCKSVIPANEERTMLIPDCAYFTMAFHPECVKEHLEDLLSECV